MLFEQFHSEDLLTPSIVDGGVNTFDIHIPSPDFYLTDYIDAYLTPVPPKSHKYETKNDINDDFSQHQDLLPDIDFLDITQLTEDPDFLSDPLMIDELEIGKWISEASFPSPQDVTNASSPSMDDSPSIQFSLYEEYTASPDMTVPPSPPLSSISSSPSIGVTRKSKLSPVERKLRKKSQNKTAAERYRIKKKSERDNLTERHLKLKTSNKILKSELETLSYQMQQLKQIFTDVLHIPLPVVN